MAALIWNRHALERMLERDLSRQAVKEVLINGEAIEDYPGGEPFPSGLFAGTIAGSPVHVVAALDVDGKRCFVITAYVPDLKHFEDDYRTRRRGEDE
jgi:hypothetical protein